MSLLQDSGPTTEAHDDPPAEDEPGHRPVLEEDAGTKEIDLTQDDGAIAVGRRRRDALDDLPMHGPVQIEHGGNITWRGMRIRRVRLVSVAKLSVVFWVLAFAVLLGTVVVVWNVARAFGFIGDIEELVVTSLGLDSFEIDGGALFGVTAAATGFLCTVGWVMTVLLAAVYNATCAVFGGLAVETGPLQRRRRVLSLRHRGFVTIRS